MFNSGNSDFTMPVVPAGYANNGNANGWGDGGWWVLIILFAIFGWGGNGFGGFGGNGTDGVLTRGALCQDMNFSQLENGVRGISQGICDSTFALNNTMTNGFAGVNQSLCQGFNGVNTNIMQGNFGLQQAINNASVANMQGQNAIQSQISDCCCGVQRAIDGVNYNMATNTCAITNQMNNNTRDIIESNNAGTRAILDYLCKEKISDLQAENQTLKLAASQADQNNFIAATQSAQTAELIRRLGADCPQPAYVVQPPQPVTFPTNCCGGVNTFNGGYGNGCGCNNSCC